MQTRNLREQILELLKSKHLLSASDIIDLLEKKGKSYNKTSVYRSLEQLHTDNIICRQFFNKDKAQYELSDDHHTHLVCQKCGTVNSTECHFVEPVLTNNFVINHHHVTLVGICEKCSKAA